MTYLASALLLESSHLITQIYWVMSVVIKDDLFYTQMGFLQKKLTDAFSSVQLLSRVQLFATP